MVKNRTFSESRSGFFNLQDQNFLTFEYAHGVIQQVKNLSDTINRLTTMKENNSAMSGVDNNEAAFFIMNRCRQRIMNIIAPSAEEKKVLTSEAAPTIKEIPANSDDPSFRIR